MKISEIMGNECLHVCKVLDFIKIFRLDEEEAEKTVYEKFSVNLIDKL